MIEGSEVGGRNVTGAKWLNLNAVPKLTALTTTSLRAERWSGYDWMTDPNRENASGVRGTAGTLGTEAVCASMPMVTAGVLLVVVVVKVSGDRRGERAE